MNGLLVLKWTMWQRNRKFLPAATLYLLLCGPILYAANHRILSENLVAFLILPGVFAFLSLFGIFIHQDADVGTKGSSFPVYLLQLPLPTWRLVLPPAIAGSITMFGVAEYIIQIVEFGSINTDSHIPAFICVAILAMLQAIFWFPIGISYSKMALTLVGIPSIGIAIAWLRDIGASSLKIELFLAAFSLAMIGVAWEGVHRARLGEVRLANIDRADRPARAKSVVKAPFASANQAQRWYEWRQHGMLLPAITLILFLLFLIPINLDTTYSPIHELRQDSSYILPTVGTVTQYYFPILIGVIPVIAWFIGCGARRSDVKSSDRTLHLFFGVRPMKESAMVAAKIRTGIKASLIAWAVAIAFSLILMIFLKGGLYDLGPGEYVGLADRSLISVLAPYLSVPTICFIASSLVLLIATTVRNYIVGYWLDLSGIPWLSILYPWILTFTVIGVSGILSWTGFGRPGSLIQFDHVAAGIWILVVVKCVCSIRLALLQRKSGLIGWPTIFRGFVIYVICAGVLTGLSLALSRGILEPMAEQYRTTETVVMLMVVGLTLFWTPIYRVLLATSMLYRNRHRSA